MDRERAEHTSVGPEDVLELRAEEARLERDLDALAAAFDRWWQAARGNSASDLDEGVRLHEAIAARLGVLAAVRDVLAEAIGAGEGSRPPAPSAPRDAGQTEPPRGRSRGGRKPKP